MLEKAKALAKEIAGRLHRDGLPCPLLHRKGSPHLYAGPGKSSPLGLVGGYEVCRKYGELLQQRLKTGTLEEAVDFFNSHGQRVRHGATIESVYADTFQHLMKCGVGVYHLRDVKRYVGNFDTFPGLISAIQTPEMDAHFARLGGSARNKNNHRKEQYVTEPKTPRQSPSLAGARR
jgi:hypothetical protein